MVCNIPLRFLTLLLSLMLGCTMETPSHYTDFDVAPAQPEFFAPGKFTTELYERDLAISADGNTYVYTLGDYKQNRRCLVQRKRSGNHWSSPKVLPFSGTFQDIEPFFSPDGKRLYFASNRPYPGREDQQDYNLWYCEIADNEWGIPIALEEAINTEGDEFYPSVAANGNLYFTATRADGIGREDIFLAQKSGETYLPPVVLDSTINTAVYEFNAYINPTEDLLIFSAYGRPDGLGGGDLYYSKKAANGNWEPAQNLGSPINSEKLDYCPFLDPSGSVLFFTSERLQQDTQRIHNSGELARLANQPGNGFGDIYWMQAPSW